MVMSLKPRPAARNAQRSPAVPKETKSEYELAEQALRENRGLQWLLRELRALSPAFQPGIEPPTPTKEAPRTPEKIRLMEERRRLGFALHHEDDPHLDGMSGQALRATRNMNGSDTEFEAVDVRLFVVESGWEKALEAIDDPNNPEMKILSAMDKEAMADDVLAFADPDPDMAKRLQRIDELLMLARRAMRQEAKRSRKRI